MTKTELGTTTVVSRHLFYLGVDGDVHELQGDADGQKWTYRNITQTLAGVVKPAAGATLAAYAFLGTNTLHVVYRGTDDRIQELWGPPGSWNHNPIGASFTKAIGDPVGYVMESFGSQHVVYRGENDRIVELLWWGIWHEQVLTNTVSTASPPRSDVAGYSFESFRTQHVVYFAQDGSPRELWWTMGGWHAGDYALQNPFPDDLGPLASPFFYEASRKDHTFFVEPYVVETTVHEWTEWIVTTREYFEPDIGRVPMIALNPKAMRMIPSEASIIKKPERLITNLFDDRVLVRTSKGVVDSGGGTFLSNSKSGEIVASKVPAKAVDIRIGGQPASGDPITKLNRESMR
jgi:hypothetical protein